jgi:hypothetical protein
MGWFGIGWLSKRILQTNRFGRRLYAEGWWRGLRVEIERVTAEQAARE